MFVVVAVRKSVSRGEFHLFAYKAVALPPKLFRKIESSF